MTEIGPLIAECATTEATNVEVVMNELRGNFIRIPEYQRDSDQWSDETKSLLVESVINNLSVPAFFFERILEGGVEKNDVIDGQQRLTTLSDFFANKLRLVGSQDAPYLSPNSIHYAGKTFDQLPEPYLAALTDQQWTNLVELVRHPAEISKTFGLEWPQSKGRWDGPKGYRAQMEAAQSVVAKIVNAR
jgi:hypothetical protein